MLAAAIVLCASLPAQTTASAAPTPTPLAAARTFHDPAYHFSFNYPANWTFSHTDREISTFHLDALTAPPSARLRAVAAMPENPFPDSTFSGAYVYLSVTPHSSAAACARQATRTAIVKNIPQISAGTPAQIAGIAFTHGHDEVKDVCITQHDEVYTTRRAGDCLRVDLAINNFCSEVSGARDITSTQLAQVRARLESILQTLRFDGK